MDSLTYKDMQVGLRYIVVTPSVNEEFQEGDHIALLDNGDVLCLEADGWMEKEHLEEACEGMTIKVDKESYKKLKDKLITQLNALEKLQHLEEIDNADF